MMKKAWNFAGKAQFHALFFYFGKALYQNFFRGYRMYLEKYPV